jgi:hypothetical protein
VKAFANVDHYTTMSLCDVIFHMCRAYKNDAMPLINKVFPHLLKCFNVTDESQINSMLSLIGKKNDDNLLSLIECTYSCIEILKQQVEPFAKEILLRGIRMVDIIFNKELLSLNA